MSKPDKIKADFIIDYLGHCKSNLLMYPPPILTGDLDHDWEIIREHSETTIKLSNFVALAVSLIVMASVAIVIWSG
ncbi:MAG TPA: hypothetical protein VMW53_07350 [archaeon]|nr:hypothetical protein [archaeon]